MKDPTSTRNMSFTPPPRLNILNMQATILVLFLSFGVTRRNDYYLKYLANEYLPKCIKIDSKVFKILPNVATFLRIWSHLLVVG